MLRRFKNKFVHREENVSRHVNILTHYDDDTLIDKDDKLIKIIQLSGVDNVTEDLQRLDIFKNRRHHLLKSFTSSFAFYFWEIKHKGVQYPEGNFYHDFAKKLNEDYRNKILKRELFHKEHYLAVITKQPEGFFNQPFNIFEKLKLSVDKSEKINYLKKRHKELTDVTNKLLNALADYDATLLKVYEKNNIVFSRPLAFLSQLLNGEPHSIPLQIEEAAQVISRKRLFFNNKSGTIEIRSANLDKKFAAILAIKGYQTFTDQKVLNDVSALNIEYVMTQSFRPFDSHVAKNKMRDQQNEMLQSKDESISQAEQIDEAFDEAASGDVGYGLHHFTLLCYADSQEKLHQHVSLIIAKFTDHDMVTVREDIGCECGFWAQLPGNFSYILRPATISTKNIAAFASFYNTPIGKLKNNYWGPPITIFETITGQPYYFNFHYKDVGNFEIFGGMGSGKTVLVGFLIAQSMKLGGKRIIFDKDRGLEILVRAMGGTYEMIKPGRPTGFNPCQLDDTVENRKFLNDLFAKILSINGEVLTPRDHELITHAIQGLYRLDPCDRQLYHLASYFGAKKSGSLRTRFDAWHSDGVHAWLFDNATDTLNLDADVLGFDLGHILKETICKTPALMYLIHRVEQALAGNRGLLFCDEGWLMLADPYFKKLIEDWSRTVRKKNIIFGLATQVANDTVHSDISKVINESSYCKIFFPNSAADKKIHIEHFGLTERQYEHIKTLPDNEHYFLLVHGQGANKESVIAKLNLTGLEKYISVFSAREQSLAVLDRLRQEIGNHPNDWLDLFYARLKLGNDV